jgi:tripartite-type tricarboxylate transporter receptor subunit TctC
MMKILVVLAALTIGAVNLSPATAQEYPRRQPIKLVVPVPPGGTTDALARITAEFLSRRLGQSVVVENKPGASSTIGTDFVAKAPADGYTLLLTGGEFAVVPATRALPYKFDEMTFLIRGFTVPPLIIANPKFPVPSATELIAKMKAEPGQVRYGSTGIGAIVHLGFALLEGATGAKGLHVPYVGIAPVFNDLMSGTLDVSMSTPPFPDTLKVVGNAGSRRNPVFPNVPTLEELGIKDATWDVWFGILAPPNLPKEVADRLIAEVSAVYRDPEAIAKFQATARAAPDAQPLVGPAFRQQTMSDYKRWKAVVDREKIVVQ